MILIIIELRQPIRIMSKIRINEETAPAASEIREAGASSAWRSKAGALERGRYSNAYGIGF